MLIQVVLEFSDGLLIDARRGGLNPQCCVVVRRRSC